MTHNLLKGKRGIIFGALNEESIAWKVAVKAAEEGATIALSNTAMALLIAALLGGIVFFASKFWIALVVNAIVSGLIALVVLIVYLFVDRRRWKRIRAMFFA